MLVLRSKTTNLQTALKLTIRGDYIVVASRLVLE